MDKNIYVKALRTSVKEFERVRREQPWPNMDLSGADLSGCDLRMAQLGRINLEGANFSNSDLTMANLTHSNLKGARFTKAKLIGVNLHKAELKDADFKGAIVSGMDQDGRMCINTEMFRNVRWGKEHIQYFIDILNQNDDWEIKYQIVPKEKK